MRRLAGSVAANPQAYDVIQKLVGVDIVDRRVARAIEKAPAGLIVDVGAGTGLAEVLRPPGTRYLAMDVDPAKLRRLRAMQPAANLILGDATAMPVASASADVLLVKAVFHHLSDSDLAALVKEAGRVLKPAGRIIVSEPVWAPARLPGRLLWAGDRGSHPRSEAALRQALEGKFDIRMWQSYAILHRYVLVSAVPISQESGGAAEDRRPGRASNRQGRS